MDLVQTTQGRLFGERFRLVNRLATGRFGELWRGADRVPSRQVAMRLLPRTPVIGEIARGLARLATLHSPFLARVYDVGKTPGSGLWIATELLMGETLASLLARRRMLPVGTAMRLVAEIAAVVADAHALGVVHGGIEPRAIVLHRDQHGRFTPKLVDFGRAQWLGQHVDVRRDVAMLRELLLDCVGRNKGDPCVEEIAHGCLLGEIGSAAAFAQRARVAASSCAGGLSALERMARVPNEYLEVARCGVIDHWPTIPGMGPGSSSSGRESSSALERPPLERSPLQHAPELPLEDEDDDPPPMSDRIAVPTDMAIDSDRFGEVPSDDEPFVDFRRQSSLAPRAVAVSCIAVLALALVGTRSEPRVMRSGAAVANVHAAAAEPPRPPPASPPAQPIEPRTAVVAQPSVVAPPPQPVVAKASVKAAPRAHEVEAPHASMAAAIPANAGIPLWVAPPKKDDNPYE